MALSQFERRQVAVGLANNDAAKQLCDAIDAASVAYAAVDKFKVALVGAGDAGADGFVDLLHEAPPVEIKSVTVIARGSFVGVDALNPIGMAVFDEDGNIIANVTYDNVTVPVDNGANLLSPLDATFKHVAADKKVYLTIECGATAVLPGLLILVRYR